MLPGTRRSGRKRNVKWILWVVVAVLVVAAAWFGYEALFSGPAVEFSGP